MTKKQPRVNKSKEELLAELKANTKFQEKMKFTREKFYPALCAATTSIDDASMLLSGWNTTIMQEFLTLMKEKTLKDLNLESKMDSNNEKHEEHKYLVSLFADMSVFDSKDLIEGMRNEIELFKTEEMKKRSLSSLETRWLDEL